MDNVDRIEAVKCINDRFNSKGILPFEKGKIYMARFLPKYYRNGYVIERVRVSLDMNFSAFTVNMEPSNRLPLFGDYFVVLSENRSNLIDDIIDTP